MIRGLFLLLGACAAYWVYGDARKRGQDKKTAALWSFGAMLASLGALQLLLLYMVVYFLMGRRVKAVSRQDDVIDIEATPVEDTVMCRMCAHTVNKDDVTCPHCGYTLRPKCEGCGQELSREWRTCPYCEKPASGK
jgi:RNA polymerase subunit RPABC4/transcription elongation factor Spt4